MAGAAFASNDKLGISDTHALDFRVDGAGRSHDRVHELARRYPVGLSACNDKLGVRVTRRVSPSLLDQSESAAASLHATRRRAHVDCANSRCCPQVTDLDRLEPCRLNGPEFPRRGPTRSACRRLGAVSRATLAAFPTRPANSLSDSRERRQPRTCTATEHSCASPPNLRCGRRLPDMNASTCAHSTQRALGSCSLFPRRHQVREGSPPSAPRKRRVARRQDAQTQTAAPLAAGFGNQPQAPRTPRPRSARSAQVRLTLSRPAPAGTCEAGALVGVRVQ